MLAKGRVNNLIISMGYGWPNNHWEERPTVYRYVLNNSHYRPLNTRAFTQAGFTGVHT